MEVNRVKIYHDFFERTKNEPLIIIQGSKRSRKTFSILTEKIGIDFYSRKTPTRYQCFSTSPKQQNFGLIDDYKSIFGGILNSTKQNSTQKTFEYGGNKLAFINISNNKLANDVSNSLGACDIRYMNECNGNTRDTFDRLYINNQKQMILDYNPYREFWVNELITDDNFLKTTWRDNPFLSKPQIDLFLQWTELGKKSEVGSYDYWRWQVMCEGNFAKMTGKIFTTNNIHFSIKKPERLHNFIIFADPSNARGGDFFALTLTAIDENGFVWLIDSFSCNRIDKVLIAEQIKKWQKDYPVQNTYIETNGKIGLKFYNDCVDSQIPVDGWYSRNDKYERIMANFDVITTKLFVLDTLQNREYAEQIYTFMSPDDPDYDDSDFHDDNIDCLNNAILAYILVFGQLKILF